MMQWLLNTGSARSWSVQLGAGQLRPSFMHTSLLAFSQLQLFLALSQASCCQLLLLQASFSLTVVYTGIYSALCMLILICCVSLSVQGPAGTTAMRRSIQGMLEELEGNLWEHILMRVVDYGHTFSPEIEMAALLGDMPMLLHGEAVNIDMAISTQVCLAAPCSETCRCSMR